MKPPKSAAQAEFDRLQSLLFSGITGLSIDLRRAAHGPAGAEASWANVGDLQRLLAGVAELRATANSISQRTVNVG